MSIRGKKSDDEVAYMLEFNDDKTQIRLTFFSGRKVTAKEFIQALAVYIEDFSDNPEGCFSFGSALDDERH
jgi:hypothetical protein